MKFTKHSYVYSFERAERLYDKVYYEVELGEGDTIKDAEKAVIEKCKQRAAQMQNEMFYGQSEQFSYGGLPLPSDYVDTSNGFKIVNQEPKEKRIGVMVDDILSCENLKVLETYRFIKDTNEELKAAYQQRYDELSNINNK